MRFNILCDADWQAKIDKVLDFLSNTNYRRFFEEQNYGKSLDGITIVLICQAPELHLKQRIRYSKKEKKLYLDIMLDLIQFKQMNQQQRDKIVANKIIAEVPSIIEKYNFSDFELDNFTEDLKKLFG